MAKPKKVQPLFPNAGVDAWYRTQLQALVLEMTRDMLRRVRAVWPPTGFATDGTITTPAAGVVFRCRFADGLLRILLLERADGSGWGLPGGGIEPGENPEDAVRREVLEELSDRYTGPLEFSHVQDWRHVRYLTYVANVQWDTLDIVLNNEHTAARWVTLSEAHQLPLFPGFKLTLDAFTDLAMDAKPTPAILLGRAMHKWGGLWVHRLELASNKLAVAFATKAKRATDAGMKRQLAQAGFTVPFKPSKGMRNAFDAVVAENVGLIRSIPQKYLGDVQNVVWQGVMNGSTMDVVADQLQEKYGIAHRRAALIARDQNHKAKAAMERARREEVGITEADWQHSHAGKDPRPTHVAMNGKRYKIGQGMWDKAVQKYIWPGTEVNCRCTDTPVIPGFE